MQYKFKIDDKEVTLDSMTTPAQFFKNFLELHAYHEKEVKKFQDVGKAFQSAFDAAIKLSLGEQAKAWEARKGAIWEICNKLNHTIDVLNYPAAAAEEAKHDKATTGSKAEGPARGADS